MKRTLLLALGAAVLVCAPPAVAAQAWVGPDLQAPYSEEGVGSFAMWWSQSFVVPGWASTHVGTSFWWSGASIDPWEHFWLAALSRDSEFDPSGHVINSRPAGWVDIGGVGAVTPGETIYLWLAGNNGDFGTDILLMPHIRITEDDTYAEGALVRRSEVTYAGDLHFKAYFTVPEPSALLLLIGGLLGVFHTVRRRPEALRDS